MSASVAFLRAARADALEARDWYDRQVDGLGGDFTSALGATLARIAKAPKQYAEVRPGVRKATLPRFPYVVLFENSRAGILVIAVFHAKRDPLIWHARTRS